ncbi:MAG: BapA/Bap/LapF family prefix-like domain-containing protein [Pseudomonadota bacterium]
MTITVQVAGLREDLAAAEPQQVSDFIALTAPSKVLVDVAPSDVVAMTREGSSLVVDRVGGEPLEVLGFFANGSGQSELYVPDEEGKLLMASMSSAPGSGSLSTKFVEASDESMRFDPDAMMADAEQEARDDATTSDRWWEQDDEPPRDEALLAGDSSAAQGQAGAEFEIDEVFLDEGVDTAEDAPGMASDPAGGEWLSGIDPGLLGFIGFGVAAGAYRAEHAHGSSSSGDREDATPDEAEAAESASGEGENVVDAEAAESAPGEGENVADAEAEAAEGMPVEDEEALLLQEDEDLLLVESEEQAAREAMAMPPQPEESGAMPAMVGLEDAFVADDDPSVAGQEVMA